MEFDAQGWALGAIAPLPFGEAWTLLSPEPDARVDAARWAHQAATFFRATLAVVQDKRYPAGTLPIADAVELDVGAKDDPARSRVLAITLPMDRVPAARRAGEEAARAIGGAGFDALVPRARRLWQVRAAPDDGGDPRAPLLVTAILASLLLAPVIPPGGGAIFGVKGARERLAAAGWRT